MADSKVSIDVVGKDRASGAFNAAGRSLDRLSKKVSGIPIVGASASKALSGLAGAISPQMIAAGAGAGLAALAAGIAVAVNKFNDLARSVLQFQRITRLSAEDSSRFIAALGEMGIETEGAANALFRLSRSEAQLKKLGIAVGDDLKESFLNVADAIESTNDANRQNTILMATFGRRGADLLPMLQQGRVGIERMFAAAEQGEVLTQEDLQKAEDYRLALDALAGASEDLALEIGGNATPALTAMALGLSALVSQGNDLTRSGLNRELAQLAVTLMEYSNPSLFFLGHIRRTGEEMLPAAKAAAKWKQGLEEAAEATQEATDAQDAMKKALRETSDAIERQSDAETSLADAKRDLNRLTEAGAVDERAVRDARDRLIDSTRGVADAEDRLGDARKRLNDLLNPSATDAEELSIRRARAQQAIGEAERRLNTVRAAGGSVTAQEEAELALREARQELARTDEDAVASAEDIEDARRDVADAELTLERSKRDVKDAGDELRRAEAGDPDFAYKLAAARERVSDAETALRRAREGAKKAIDEERVATDALVQSRQAIIDQAPGFFGSIAGPIGDFAKPGIMGRMAEIGAASTSTSTVTVNAYGIGADEATDLIIQKLATDTRLKNLVG